jgi:hypothetical protein
LKRYVSEKNILFIMLADVRIKEWHHVHAKAACTSVKLGSDSGSCSHTLAINTQPTNAFSSALPLHQHSLSGRGMALLV